MKVTHLPFLSFIFDDRHYNLTACQKSFELPWHELLSPVLLNINHYHRCLFWLVFEWTAGVNNLIWALFKPDFPAVIWRKKWKCFIFWREQKGMDCVLVCCFDEIFAGFRCDRPRHQDGLFKGKNSKLQHARCSMIFSWMTWFRYLFTVIIRFKNGFISTCKLGIPNYKTILRSKYLVTYLHSS